MANSKTAKKSAKVTNVDPIRSPATAAKSSLEKSANLSEDERARWVRDDPDRISQVMEIGYDFKKDKDGEKIVSRGMVLMVLPEEEAQERDRAKIQRAGELSKAGTARLRQAAGDVVVEDNTKTRRAGAAAASEDE